MFILKQTYTNKICRNLLLNFAYHSRDVSEGFESKKNFAHLQNLYVRFKEKFYSNKLDMKLKLMHLFASERKK